MQPRSEDTIDELAQVAWTRIEQTLYKFTPGRAKAFSFWTRITYLSCLAYIKKHTRDACAIRTWGKAGSPPHQMRSIEQEEPREDFYKVMAELRELVSDNPEHVEMVDFLVDHYETSENPSAGVLGALARRFGREKAKGFLERVREEL
jgi:DNA-directed RNA polymerase specialized sigma24 family protein